MLNIIVIHVCNFSIIPHVSYRVTCFKKLQATRYISELPWSFPKECHSVSKLLEGTPYILNLLYDFKELVCSQIWSSPS